MPTVENGKQYAKIILGRYSPETSGSPGNRDQFPERVIEDATVRVFDQEGETRYEATGTVVVPTRLGMDGLLTERREEATVGFLAEDVLSAK